MDLYRRSIEIIEQNQAPSGAYVASPSFPTYQYSWFRDGAFIAYAMDLVGNHPSAARFHDWVASTLRSRAGTIHHAVRQAREGLPLQPGDQLHTRYTLDGREYQGEEAWPNFQLDGFGAWLWALNEHVRLSGNAPAAHWLEAAGLLAAYLAALWPSPCFDCWEEFPDQVHLYTLAAIYGGLQAHQQLAGVDHTQTCQDIAGFSLSAGMLDGCLVKFVGSRLVDASLLGLSTPYRLLEPGDPRMKATVERIRKELAPQGGVHRYRSDTYYGGGEWVLLTAWLGWHALEMGRPDEARACLAWVEAQADEQGRLPEQVSRNLNDASYFQPWVQRWGPAANPLLWSHAKYLILKTKLKDS